ncbi:hypothetical protein G6O69_04655 [Pseudenhygromyxa sp. WMMC2535]|uniref:lipase secretion chaperone n=1 Tax=Pseudenhygromyxa sp. WMMC2535 TaxID=2712867 RepID=UPI001595E864|nr:lipase secretion chaperone [Pseudenhygromyxa sp. WMMC2535]NVB37109.1 hypothetical protein [Pseudenhygromyxa sp. WMMC2535]
MKRHMRSLCTLLSATLAVATLATACADESETREFGDVPRSLAGTEADGQFSFDGAGAFVFDEQARLAFDYFSTADGELSPEALDAWVSTEVRELVGDADAHAQIMAAWTAYLSFRAEAAAALEVSASADIEAQLLASLDAHFGETPFAVAERERIVQGFDLHAAYAITDEAARAAELARLSADEAERFEQSRAGRFLAGRRAVEAARVEGASPEAVEALRVEHFDALEPGAAQRLAALDARRAEWARRVSEYRAERDALRGELVGAAAPELDAAVEALERDRFSAAERRRLHALDDIASE